MPTLVTPQRLYREYQAGLKQMYKPGMSEAEIAERKAEYDQRIGELLEQKTLYQREIIEQAGTVQAARERSRSQLREAAINAYADIYSQEVDTSGRIREAQIDAALERSLDERNGTLETNERVTETREAIYGMAAANAEPPASLQSEQEHQNFLNDYLVNTFIARRGEGLDIEVNNGVRDVRSNANQRRLYRDGVRAEFKAKVESDLDGYLNKDATGNDLTPEERIQRQQYLDKYMDEFIDAKIPAMKSDETELATSQRIQDEANNRIRTLERQFHGGGASTVRREFADWLEEQPPETMEQTIQQMRGVEGDPELEAELEKLKADRANLGRPELTPFGNFYFMYRDIDNQKDNQMTQILGFNDQVEAAYVYAMNPGALAKVIENFEAYETPEAMDLAYSEMLKPNIKNKERQQEMSDEFELLTPTEKRQAMIASDLNMLNVGSPKINSLRLRMALSRQASGIAPARPGRVSITTQPVEDAQASATPTPQRSRVDDTGARDTGGAPSVPPVEETSEDAVDTPPTEETPGTSTEETSAQSSEEDALLSGALQASILDQDEDLEERLGSNPVRRFRGRTLQEIARDPGIYQGPSESTRFVSVEGLQLPSGAGLDTAVKTITDPQGNQSSGIRVKDPTNNVEYFLPETYVESLIDINNTSGSPIFKVEEGKMKINQNFIDTGLQTGELQMYGAPPESDAVPSPPNTSTVPPVNQRFDRSGFATSTRNPFKPKDLPKQNNLLAQKFR